MDIYVKGMEMPKPGQIVLVEIDENGDVFAAYDGGRTKLADYKAIPVPPHGDLIERDKLREKEFIHDGDAYAVVMSRDIRNAPTIIPASEEHTMEEFMYRQEGNPNDGSM